MFGDMRQDRLLLNNLLVHWEAAILEIITMKLQIKKGISKDMIQPDNLTVYENT